MNFSGPQSRRSFAKNTAALVATTAIMTSSRSEAGAHTAETGKEVTYRFYRNATAKLTYAGLTLLLDPMLSKKGELPSFAGIEPNPTVELPVATDQIIEGIDAVIVSHLHEDHFDDAAAAILDKDIPLISPRNEAPVTISDPSVKISHKQRLVDYGFTDVREMDADGEGSITFEGVTMTQVWALHGRGHVGDLMGGVNGIILSAPGMPTIYWAGDTIFNADEFEPILATYKPDVVIAHTGGPLIEALSPEILLMDAAEGVEFAKMANRYNPDVQIIAIHMEALDHCFSTRPDLRLAVDSLDQSIGERFMIPSDGDIIILS